MAKRLSATQLKCAVLDPDYRRRLALGERPNLGRPVPPGGGPAVKGALFHKLAEDFTHWLCHGQAQGPAELSTPDALWQALYEHFAEKELTKLTGARQVESAYHLSRCLRAFCARLNDLRQTIAGFTDWQDLFLDMELPIDGVEIDGTGLTVCGRVDAVRADTAHGVVVVDYKLSQGGQAKHDLLQLAIYAYLLEASRPGLRFTGLLEYYDPELTCIDVSPAELRDLFDDMVRPVVDELAAGTRPSAATARPTSTEEPDLSAQLVETFGDFRLNVEVVSRVAAPQIVRYKIRPAPGVKVVSLANRAEDVQVRLALPSPPRIEPGRGYVSVDIPKAKPATVYWRDVQADGALTHHDSRVVFPIGVGVEGNVLLADFADPNTCHALIAGTSGSGKSEFLRSMCASLLKRNQPATLRLTLIDPKILTFGGLRDFPHVTGPVISDLDGAIACLEQAVEDMDDRYQQLADEGFNNLAQRIRTGRGDLPFHLIVFDEFADLVLAGKKEKATFENLVARLAAKGRAAGLHLVLATQRPDRNIVTGPIKANLPLKVCLKVTNAINSQIILDEPGAEALVGRGDLLCDRGSGIERAQAPFVEAGDLQELLAYARGSE
jgi:S-DNA-T family DNA segregation ATPase FtsK/SpoIIIE